MLSFTDFLHFKHLIIQIKKNMLFVGKALVDDTIFIFSNLFKMIKIKNNIILQTKNKFEHYLYHH